MKRLQRSLAALTSLASSSAVVALAQDTGDRATSFQAVSGSAHEDVPGGTLLVAAYAAVLLLFGLYVVYLTAMQQSTAKELTRLEALLTKSEKPETKKD